MANRQEEVFESSISSSGDPAKWAESLFEQMQGTMHFLLQKYQIQEIDLKNTLNVIGQLWELVEETQTSCDNTRDQLRELEEKWKEEKGMRRLVEKRKSELESKFDEDRYQWQAEKQEMQKEKVLLETKNKHLMERNNELCEDIIKQKEQFDSNQKMRDELTDQYKKQYELARTSSLRRTKKSKSISRSLPTPPGVMDYTAPARRQMPVPAHSSQNHTHNHYQSTIPEEKEGGSGGPTMSPGHRGRLPKNVVSLRTEMEHRETTAGDDENETENGTPISEEDDILQSYHETFSLQQELLNVSPEILAPAAAELEVLRKELEETKRANDSLKERFETVRKDKEDIEGESAQVALEAEYYRKEMEELQEQLALLRTERDEILECYLDQPFDVYCVTKKELHEVLKKLHETQLEVHRQNEEKQSLRMQLEKGRKKGGWKRFAEKFKNVFHRHDNASKAVPMVTVEETFTSLTVPSEAPFSPHDPEYIINLPDHELSKGWLVPKDAVPSPSSLPSLYCQITLKEYHVTEKINCMAVGCVTHVLHSPSKRKLNLIPLAARTMRGRLTAQVWVASSEGPASFIEIIDVLAKKVVDRFLVKGTQVVGMVAVQGSLAPLKSSPQTPRTPKGSSKDSNDLLGVDNFDPNYFSSSPVPIRATNGIEFHDGRKESDQESAHSLVAKEYSPSNQTPPMYEVMVGSDSSHPLEGSSTGDEEIDGPARLIGGMATYSTPRKEDEESVLSFTDGGRGVDVKLEHTYMWVISDSEVLNIYPVHDQCSKPVRSIVLPAIPSCIKHLDNMLFIGLIDSKLLVYHYETITSGGSWDLDNHTSVDLPLLNPDKMQPVYSVEMVNNKIWVTTGSFISLLNAETLEREGMRFVDTVNNIPNHLLYVKEVVIVTVLQGPFLYVLDTVRAEVVKKIDISATSVLLDNILSFSDLNITQLSKDTTNLYIGTSHGKVVAIPLSFFDSFRENRDPSSPTFTCYPPESGAGELFKTSAVALHAHRESQIQGLLYIPLPEGATLGSSLSTSTQNLSATHSTPSLLVDSPPLNRSKKGTTSHVYHSLLVTGGKGHKDYVADQDQFQESTALRERNDAFQLMIWGYDDQSSTMDDLTLQC